MRRILSPRRLLPFLPAVALASCIGCQQSDQIRGSVFFEGKPLNKGYITFFPASGTDNAIGAPVEKGLFTLPSLEPGSKRVLITAHPEIIDGALISAQPVSSSCPGNNQIIEVTNKAQELRFDLKTAPSAVASGP